MDFAIKRATKWATKLMRIRGRRDLGEISPWADAVKLYTMLKTNSPDLRPKLMLPSRRCQAGIDSAMT
jgi:hypothetical protein